MFGWVLRDDGFTGYTVGEGWYRNGEERTDFDFPGASNTHAWDVNLHGCTVGWYGPSASSRGFVRHASGAFVSIGVPGATWTRALGMNAGHVVVGAYRDGSGTHGFVLSPPY